MSEQAILIMEGVLAIGASEVFRRFRRAAIAASLVILAGKGAGFLEAQTKTTATPSANSTTQNVNVVNTPSVNVVTMPPVSINGTATVNVATMPAVTVAGTPNVNANVTFPANQAVTVAAAGPLTHTGRLPSQMVALLPGVIFGCAAWAQVTPDGNFTCFDMANHPGQILIITDFYWAGEGPAGSTCQARILGGGANWYLIKSGATVNSDGFTTKSEHFTTGVGTTANPILQGVPGAACGVFDAELHGYLLPNE